MILCDIVKAFFPFSNKKIIHEGDLSSGEHYIPFTFDLPMDLPCSFEGQYGHVRYAKNNDNTNPTRFMFQYNV